MDIRPLAGENGGEVVAIGTAQELMDNPNSITKFAYLSGKRKIPVPEVRRQPQGYLTVKGAQENNLKNIDVKFPLGVFTCVTGVSGSGKSSLVNEILYKKLACVLNRARIKPGKHKEIEGTEQLDKIINIDQSQSVVPSFQSGNLYRRVRSYPGTICHDKRCQSKRIR